MISNKKLQLYNQVFLKQKYHRTNLPVAHTYKTPPPVSLLKVRRKVNVLSEHRLLRDPLDIGEATRLRLEVQRNLSTSKRLEKRNHATSSKTLRTKGVKKTFYEIYISR